MVNHFSNADKNAAKALAIRFLKEKKLDIIMNDIIIVYIY